LQESKEVNAARRATKCRPKNKLARLIISLPKSTRCALICLKVLQENEYKDLKREIEE